MMEIQRKYYKKYIKYTKYLLICKEEKINETTTTKIIRIIFLTDFVIYDVFQEILNVLLQLSNI